MTAILFWRWMPHLNSALIGPPEDNMQDFWNTRYARVRGFFCYQYDKVCGGGGRPLYYHSFAYPKVFAVALFIQVYRYRAAHFTLLQNISLLISFPLAGVGAFYLVRHFTQNGVGALTGSFVFAFNPSHVAHM